jgi:hypothetical protein
MAAGVELAAAGRFRTVLSCLFTRARSVQPMRV